VITYAVSGLWLSATIPFGYQVLSLLGLALYPRSRRFERFRSHQLAMILLLPFLLQWSLGGSVASSGVALWAR
jgi:hypothetical protein